MSHVIPLWLFQVLKSDRWDCNVFLSPKKSEGTQITCDFWGGRGLGEAGEGEAGGRDEAGARLRIAGTLAGASRAAAFGEAEPTCGPISEGLATIRSFVTACRARPRGAPIC